jgi:hypothetical protein
MERINEAQLNQMTQQRPCSCSANQAMQQRIHPPANQAMEKQAMEQQVMQQVMQQLSTSSRLQQTDFVTTISSSHTRRAIGGAEKEAAKPETEMSWKKDRLARVLRGDTSSLATLKAE